MAKHKFDIANTNIANLGSELEKEVKKTAAQCAQEWQNAGKVPGVQVWRIEKFQVVPWPVPSYGKFFGGDSYIILGTYTKDKRDKLYHDIYFWIGEDSTQDEYGTAAYKAAELDNHLNGAATQYREIMGHESARFKTIFKTIQIMSGGVESGFNAVKPAQYRPRLLHLKGKDNVIVRDVPISVNSMNSGDSFILDLGMKVFVWHGKTAGSTEKNKAMSLAQAMDDERGGKVVRMVFSEGSESDEFWHFLGGKGPIKTAAEGGADEKVSAEFTVPRLLVLSNMSGALKLSVVAEGPKIVWAMLKSSDVFILDTAVQVFVWIGKNSSKEERTYAMDRANQYMREYGREPTTPVCKTVEGSEEEAFMTFFGNQVASGAAAAAAAKPYQAPGVDASKAVPAGPIVNPKDVPIPVDADHNKSVQRRWTEPVFGSLDAPEKIDAKADAETLRRAMKGLGTDVTTLIDVLCHRTQKQRMAIRENFKEHLKRDLEKDLKSELSMNIATLMKALVRTPEEREARFLYKCVKGLGTDDALLIEMLCTKESAQIAVMKEAYKKANNDRDLEKDVIGDTSGSYQALFKAILQCKRPVAGAVDEQLAAADAISLYRAGEGRIGTDEQTFIDILTSRSFVHLNRVFELYKEKSQKKNDIRDAIISETSFNFKQGLLTIVDFARNPTEMYAFRLYSAMKGLGTHNLVLIYTVIERSEIDLGSIKKIYKQKFGISLADHIRDDTSGDFRKALLTLIGEKLA